MPNRLKEYFRYLPPGPQERQWGLYVTGAGYQLTDPEEHYPPPGHPITHNFSWDRGRVLDQYGIVYLVQGEGEFDSKQTGLCHLNVGDAIIIFPGFWHRYRPVKKIGWKEYWVLFQGEDAERMQQRGFITPEKPILRAGLADTIIDPFLHILDGIRAEPVGFQQMIAASTMQIIAATLGAVRKQEMGSHIFEKIKQAKALLEQDLRELPLMENIAEELQMSRAQFFRVFRKHTGLTPYQYHLELKLNRARQMLCDSEFSVEQIARILGFKNVCHFSKLFKNKVGMAPTPWRMNRHIQDS